MSVPQGSRGSDSGHPCLLVSIRYWRTGNCHGRGRRSEHRRSVINSGTEACGLIARRARTKVIQLPGWRLGSQPERAESASSASSAVTADTCHGNAEEPIGGSYLTTFPDGDSEPQECTAFVPLSHRFLRLWRIASELRSYLLLLFFQVFVAKLTELVWWLEFRTTFESDLRSRVSA